MTRLPASSTAVPCAIDAANFGGLVAALEPGRCALLGPETRPLFHRYAVWPSRFSWTRDLQTAKVKNARKDAAALRKAFPLRRFMLAPDFQHAYRDGSGDVVVYEGLSLTARIAVSTLFCSLVRVTMHISYSSSPQVSRFRNCSGTILHLNIPERARGLTRRI